MKKIFTKIKHYFTANPCRKIFFLGLLLALLLYGSNIFFQATSLKMLGLLCLIVAIGASLVDTMLARTTFVRKVKEMQYEHLQEVFEKQQAGEAVPVTTTFSPSEKKYIKRKKWAFIGLIVLKMIILLCLFPLLFNP